MAESLVVPSSVRVALERIVDYAGLFPPAKLPIEAAAAEYERCRQSPHAWMLGRFVVPAAQLAPLESSLGGSEPVAAAVLFDAQTPVRASARVTPESCEVALRLADYEIGASRTASRALRKGLEDLAPGLAVVVELPRGLGSALLAEAFDALAETGFAAKIRCGGVSAEATPSIEEVADFIRAASRRHVAFKGTAGLHHPVRHFNTASGFTMHGFLNVLAAAAAAPSCDSATLRAIVGEEDPASFALDERGLSWRESVLADMQALTNLRRSVFLSFGSCSFTEPIEDLVGIGVLPAT